MQLVIAEKPSVGRSVASVIGATEKKDGYLEGNGYIVTWCIGHLVQLASPDKYDSKYGTKISEWSFSTLPILPEHWKFVVSSTTKQQFQVIQELMQDSRVDEIICATDAGREGECIFRYVQNLVNAFGFLQWKIKQSVRDFQIFTLTATMTTYMQLDFVGQRQTGLLD